MYGSTLDWGRTRVRGLGFAMSSALGALVLSSAGCELGSGSFSDELGVAAAGSFATSDGGFSTGGFSTGGFSTGGFSTGGFSTGGFSTGGDPGIVSTTGGQFEGESEGGGCDLFIVDHPIFEDQVLAYSVSARAELYSWTTDEQAAALRSNQVLFSQVERADFSMPALATLIATEPDTDLGKLATILSGDLFAKGRFAWPEPWAMRFDPSGADLGGNLLRIVLKPEAWVAVVKGGGISVLDMQQQPVALADAVATPERLGAIFHEKDESDGGPSCTGLDLGLTPGFREFIVGNLEMVQEWSIATQTIADRLTSNIDQLTRFFTTERTCPNEAGESGWNEQVVCGWNLPVAAPASEEAAYEGSLAIPSHDYFISPAQLAALIDTLQADTFQVDPLVVTAGSP